MDDFYVALGEAIRRRRNAIGMTQESLAQRSGLLRTSITNIERGRQAVLVHQLVALVRALNTSVQDLLSATHRDAPADPEPVSEEMIVLLQRLGAPKRQRSKA